MHLALLNLDDEVLELGLTPNRSDCLSMLGVAYEVAAILGQRSEIAGNRTCKKQLKKHLIILKSKSKQKKIIHYMLQKSLKM